jgi:hypothetical protein
VNKIIPAPSGWTFHAAEDWELNRGEPVHSVFPLFAFELSEEHAGRFSEAVGLFLEGDHEIGYTDEKGPYRFPIGVFGPHQGPSTEVIGEALATVRMTAANARKKQAV